MTLQQEADGERDEEQDQEDRGSAPGAEGEEVGDRVGQHGGGKGDDAGHQHRDAEDPQVRRASPRSLVLRQGRCPRIAEVDRTGLGPQADHGDQRRAADQEAAPATRTEGRRGSGGRLAGPASVLRAGRRGVLSANGYSALTRVHIAVHASRCSCGDGRREVRRLQDRRIVDPEGLDHDRVLDGRPSRRCSRSRSRTCVTALLQVSSASLASRNSSASSGLSLVGADAVQADPRVPPFLRIGVGHGRALVEGGRVAALPGVGDPDARR